MASSVVLPSPTTKTGTNQRIPQTPPSATLPRKAPQLAGQGYDAPAASSAVAAFTSKAAPGVSSAPVAPCSPSSAMPKVVCACGNMLLFPNGTTMRSCYKCGREARLEMNGAGGSNIGIVERLSVPRFGNDPAGGDTTPKRTCTCGTVLIFHGGASERTCMRCGKRTNLSGELVAGDEPLGCSGQPTRRFSAPGDMLAAAAAAVSATDVAKEPVLAPDSNRKQVSFALERPLSSSWGFPTRMGMIFLVGSCLALSSWRARMQPEARHGAHDTDGDGVPDEQDRCNWYAYHASMGKQRGWRSGLTTDFDGDGCMDNVEDRDKDNDGIRDDQDGCPMTPQHFAFVSTMISDFDGDGCADGLEDDDNDGDKVPNMKDDCPRTVLGHQTNISGCSLVQRRFMEQDKDPKWWEMTTGFGSFPHQRLALEKVPASQMLSWWEEWYSVLRGAWVEVILGAVLTAVLTKLHQTTARLHDQLFDQQTTAVQRSEPEQPKVEEFARTEAAPLVID